MKALPQEVDLFFEVKAMDMILQVVLQSDLFVPIWLSSLVPSVFLPWYFLWEIKKDVRVNACHWRAVSVSRGCLLKHPLAKTGA